jgi:hypothetical protein
MGQPPELTTATVSFQLELIPHTQTTNRQIFTNRLTDGVLFPLLDFTARYPGYQACPRPFVNSETNAMSVIIAIVYCAEYITPVISRSNSCQEDHVLTNASLPFVGNG